jgi:hypothetical protein
MRKILTILTLVVLMVITLLAVNLLNTVGARITNVAGALFVNANATFTGRVIQVDSAALRITLQGSVLLSGAPAMLNDRPWTGQLTLNLRLASSGVLRPTGQGRLHFTVLDAQGSPFNLVAVVNEAVINGDVFSVGADVIVTGEADDTSGGIGLSMDDFEETQLAGLDATIGAWTLSPGMLTLMGELGNEMTATASAGGTSTVPTMGPPVATVAPST